MTDHAARRPRSRLLWGVVALGVVLAVLAATLWLTRAPAEAPTPGEATPASEEPTSASPVVEGTELPPATEAPREPGDPLWIRIPAIGVDSDVLPILAPGGVLTPPSDPQQLGWWADGARPGDRLGSSLMTGHTVSTGGGALDDLEELGRGDRVRVGSTTGRSSYVVRNVEIYEKGDLARRAEELFDQSAPGRLVLITCEDWDGSAYLSNVVVTAVPVGAA